MFVCLFVSNVCVCEEPPLPSHFLKIEMQNPVYLRVACTPVLRVKQCEELSFDEKSLNLESQPSVSTGRIPSIPTNLNIISKFSIIILSETF